MCLYVYVCTVHIIGIIYKNYTTITSYHSYIGMVYIISSRCYIIYT